MMTADVLQGSTRGLPPALTTAQAAIRLPEVQEMLRKLSEYQLGVFMPHMHDQRTGEFMPLADEVMQVESGLEVSFQPRKEIATQKDRFLPVSWIWRAGASAPAAVCEMAGDEGCDNTERFVKHKMGNTN